MNATGEEVERTAFLTASAIVREAPAGSFALIDVFDIDVWRALLAADLGAHAVVGVVNGCVKALVERNISALDLLFVSAPTVGIKISEVDLKIARQWLDLGLLAAESAKEFRGPAVTLAARGWLSQPARIATLMIATLLIAVKSAVAPAADSGSDQKSGRRSLRLVRTIGAAGNRSS